MAGAAGEDGRVAPVYLLVGDAGPLRQRAETELLERLLPEGANGFNHASHVAGEPGDAMGTARSQPMMVRRRVVQIRELENAGDDLLVDILAYVERPNPVTVLVLSGTKLPPARKGKNLGRRLSNAVKKLGELRQFKARDQDPLRFAQDHAERAGCRLDRGAARLLVQLVGKDLGRLACEVDKLAVHVGGEGSIGSDAVEEVCSLVAEAVVWELTDAIVARDPDRALAACHRMLEGGGASGSSHRLLSMVSWQVRQMLELQSAMRRRGPLPASVSRMPARKRQLAERQLRARVLDPAGTLEALATANVQLNRSRAGDKRVFEALVLRLTAR
jgi:DNA polymerase-3 subunit delta